MNHHFLPIAHQQVVYPEVSRVHQPSMSHIK